MPVQNVNSDQNSGLKNLTGFVEQKRTRFSELLIRERGIVASARIRLEQRKELLLAELERRQEEAERALKQKQEEERQKAETENTAAEAVSEQAAETYSEPQTEAAEKKKQPLVKEDVIKPAEQAVAEPKKAPFAPTERAAAPKQAKTEEQSL